MRRVAVRSDRPHRRRRRRHERHRPRAGARARRRRRGRRRDRRRREALVDEVARDDRSARPADAARAVATSANVASLERLRDACLADVRQGRHRSSSPPGSTKRVPTLDMAEADWSAILETNLTGTLRSLPGVRPADGGARDPAASSRSRRWRRSSGCSKSPRTRRARPAVAGLTRALAVEWAPHGVTVNAIAPGVFKTDLNRALLETPRGQEFLMRTPMQRFGTRRGARRRRGLSRVGRGQRSSPARCSPSTAGSWRAGSTNEAGARDQRRATTSRPRSRHSSRAQVDRERRGGRRSREAIPRGHKIALCAIAAGEAVVKYGSPIGHARRGDRGRRARAHAQRRQQPRPRRPASGQRSQLASAEPPDVPRPLRRVDD